MYMKGLCENVKGAWDWLFHEHISRRIMAVFVIFFLISFFLTYSLYSWAARKQEDSMIEQSSVQMVTGVRNNLDEMVLNVNDDFNMLLKGGTLDVVNHLPRPEDRKHMTTCCLPLLTATIIWSPSIFWIFGAPVRRGQA